MTTKIETQVEITPADAGLAAARQEAQAIRDRDHDQRQLLQLAMFVDGGLLSLAEANAELAPLGRGIVFNREGRAVIVSVPPEETL